MIILSYIFYFFLTSVASLQIRWLAVRKNADSKEQIRFAFEVVLIIVLCSLVLPFLSPFYFSGNFFYLFFLTLVCGLFGMGYFIATYMAQKHIDAGITTLISNICVPITIILSFIFLREGLNFMQILGTIILLIAVFIVSKKHRIGKFTFDKYFLMMIFGYLMLGVLIVAERALQKTTGLSAGTMMSWWSQCFFLGLAVLFTQSKSIYTKQEVLATGFLRFLSAFSWVTLVWLVGNLSLVTSITTFKVIIMFILGAMILNEREDLPRKIFGSIIAVIGLLLMK